MSKPKNKKYPKDLYDGITSDPDTWGMCCSEEMARKCAESNYDIRWKTRMQYLKYCIIQEIPTIVFTIILLSIFILWVLDCISSN